jgi:hypothetical protein
MPVTTSAIPKPWWLLPSGRVAPFWWYAMGAALMAFDFFAGPDAQFPVLYLVPVILAAWYSGRVPALAIAVAVPAAHLFFLIAWWTPSAPLWLPVSATIFRACVILLLALWFARLSEHERDLHGYVVRLEGLLPICSFCKSIRNQQGDWERLESFISRRSDTKFSHGLCPDCGRQHYPDLDLDDAAPDRLELKH